MSKEDEGGGAGGDDGAAQAAADKADAAAGGGGTGVLDEARARADAAKLAGGGDEAAKPAKVTADAEAAVKLAGIRPDWLPEQFWDPATKAMRNEAMVKSWKDTSAELKTLKGAKGAPPAKAEDYKFERSKELPAHILKDPATDNDLKVLREVSHAAKLTQVQFDALVNGYFAKAGEMIPAPADPVEEIKKLGENGAQVADTVFSWLDGLVATEVLSKVELDEVVATGATAAGLRALNKIREHSGGVPIPIGAPEGASSYTADELYAMVGTEKYKKESAERARVDRLFEQHFGTAPAGSSQAGVGVR